MWYRASSKNAKAPNDGLGPLQNSQSFDDDFYVFTLLNKPAKITIHSGSTSKTFNAQAGRGEFSMPFAEGQQVRLQRDKF